MDLQNEAIQLVSAASHTYKSITPFFTKPDEPELLLFNLGLSNCKK